MFPGTGDTMETQIEFLDWDAISISISESVKSTTTACSTMRHVFNGVIQPYS